MKKLRSRYDAFVLALSLAISAASEEDSAKALAFAQDFGHSLTAKQLTRGKMQALQVLGKSNAMQRKSGNYAAGTNRRTV